MDPATHFLAGAVLADTLPVAKRSSGSLAVFAGILAASPDLDLIATFIANLPGNLIPGN